MSLQERSIRVMHDATHGALEELWTATGACTIEAQQRCVASMPQAERVVPVPGMLLDIMGAIDIDETPGLVRPRESNPQSPDGARAPSLLAGR